ncbi:tail collar protein [Pseudomonas phage MiCath]|uniref:Tail collar protein n=1 Tax=Pseudomonas phage MiCath TaxID=3003729 RepID=A0AAF0AGS9_9CAUD|nr:tail collar protein [Pseudomonas phage MiCath]WAX22423.1 tail collar protein [Pseudomonas phage MiCath]
MANFFPRFSTKWAVNNGSLETPTDGQAEQGFIYLNNDPPTTALHDQLFQWLDEKDNYLFALINAAVVERTGAALTETDVDALKNAISLYATVSKSGVLQIASQAEVQANTPSAVKAVTMSNIGWLVATTLRAGIAKLATTEQAAARNDNTTIITPLLLGQEIAKIVTIPPGMYGSFPMTSLPAGWLLCNGAVLVRATYPELFAAIGTTYNTGGELATEFRLPDRRGLFPRALDLGRGIDASRALGPTQQSHMTASHAHTASAAAAGGHNHTGTTAAGGGHTHTASTAGAGGHNHTGTTAANNVGHTHTFSGTTAGHSVNHTHTFSGTTSTIGDHTHTAPRAQNNNVGGGSPNFTTANLLNGTTAPTNPAGAHSHTYSGTTAGANVSHTHTYSGTTSAQSANHTHTVTVTTVGDHAHTVTVAAAADHTHTFTASTVADHTHTITVNAAGGIETRPHNFAEVVAIHI